MRPQLKRTLVILTMVALIASTINILVAVHLFLPYTAQHPPAVINIRGAEAAARGWPARTPHPGPWPTVTSWTLCRSPGRTQMQAWGSTNGQTTHQMSMETYGWPLPVLSDTMRWWPDQDPAWMLSAPHDTGLQLRWSGLILNPLMAAAAAWLLLMAPFAAKRTLIRRWRLKRSQCPGCGYPMGVCERCTECGIILPARPAAKSP